MVLDTTSNTSGNICDLIKNILPTSIKEFLLIIVICCIIYYLYISQEEIVFLKKENLLYEKHLKKIINGDTEDIETVKNYFNNVNNNIISKQEIENFKNNKKKINKDAF